MIIMERMVIKNGKNYTFVKVNNIEWIESEGNYIRIHIEEKSHLMRETLNNIEKKLNPEEFIRINRSTIVNINQIKELKSIKYSKYMVVLSNKRTWIWGTKFRDNLKRILNQ